MTMNKARIKFISILCSPKREIYILGKYKL
jgi:hypothetical protein